MESNINNLIPDLDLFKLNYSKIFKIFGFSILINLIFSTILYTFCYGQITNAKTIVDYIYFGFQIYTTVGYGDMNPNSDLTRGIISVYLLIIFAILTSVALP